MTDKLLSEYSHLSSANRHGRNPYEGYQRGFGIHFEGLVDRVRAEPDYQEAYALAAPRTVVGESRLINIYLLIRCFMPRLKFGHIIEFGSYRGGSAMFMASIANHYLPGAQIYALDTFEGMPETDNSIDTHRAGDFGDANFNEITQAVSDANLSNLSLVRGLFDFTALDVVKSCGAIALAHIDCDIYYPAKFASNIVMPAMVPGGYIVFDDATEPSCLGASEAVEDLIHEHDLRSEQVYPHFVFRYPALS